MNEELEQLVLAMEQADASPEEIAAEVKKYHEQKEQDAENDTSQDSVDLNVANQDPFAYQRSEEADQIVSEQLAEGEEEQAETIPSFVAADILSLDDTILAPGLQKKWLRYGFLVDSQYFDGEDKITITAENGETRSWNVQQGEEENRNISNEINQWMTPRAVDHGSSFKGSLALSTIGEEERQGYIDFYDEQYAEYFARKAEDKAEMDEEIQKDEESPGYIPLITDDLTSTESTSYEVEEEEPLDLKPFYVGGQTLYRDNTKSIASYSDVEQQGEQVDQDLDRDEKLESLTDKEKEEAFDSQFESKLFQAQRDIAIQTWFESKNFTPKQREEYKFKEEDWDEIDDIAVDIPLEDPRVKNIARKRSIEEMIVKNVEEKAGAQVDLFDYNAFFKGKFQKDLEEQAVDYGEQLSEESKRVVAKSAVMFEEIERLDSTIAEGISWLEENNPTERINELVNGSYSTQEEADKAQAEINSLVSSFSEKYNSHRELIDLKSTYYKAAGSINNDIENLQLQESELRYFTKAMGKNYTWGTGIGNTLQQAVIEIVKGAESLAYMVNPLGAFTDHMLETQVENEWLRTGIEAVRFTSGVPLASNYSDFNGDGVTNRSIFKESIGNYQTWMNTEVIGTGTRFEDISNIGGALEWGTNAVVGQLPQVGLLIASGGTYGTVLLGGIAAGNTFDSLDAEKDQYIQSGGLYGRDIGFGNMLLQSVGTGLIEFGSEKITFGIANDTFRVMRTMGASPNAINRSLGRKLWDTSLTIGREGAIVAKEGGSEWLATIGSNMVAIAGGDESVGIFDGGLESMITGKLVGGGLRAPVWGKQMMSPFASRNQTNLLDKNFLTIQRLTNERSQLDPEKDAERIAQIEEQLGTLVYENSQAIVRDVKRIDALQPQQIKTLVNIESDNRKLKVAKKEVEADANLSEQQKTEEISAIDTKIESNLDAKEEILQSVPESVINEEYERKLENAKRMALQIEEAGGPEVIVTDGLAVDMAQWVRSKQEQGAQGIAASQAAGDMGYGAMYPVLDSDGNVIRYEVFINREFVNEDDAMGTDAHEFAHLILHNTLKQDPALRDQMAKEVEEILKSDGVTISDKARESLKRLNAVDEGGIPFYKDSEKGEELIAIVSEMMDEGEITIDDTRASNFKDTFRRFFEGVLGKDIEFNTNQDVRNFLKDYSRAVRKGELSPALLSMVVGGAKGDIVQNDATPTEEQIVDRTIENAKEKAEMQFSQAVDSKLKSSPDLKAEFDQYTKNEDGTPKHKNQEEWENSEDYWNAYFKIRDGVFLDGLIQHKMTEKGLPPAALRDFTRKVKEAIGDRFLPTVDKKTGKVKPGSGYQISNDSLFGWLTGVAGGAGMSVIYRAKGDIMKQYRESGEAQTSSLDNVINDGMVVGDFVQADVDASMAAFEVADLSQRTRDAQGPSKFVETVGMDTDLVDQIKSTVSSANLDIKNLTYKDVKKLTTGTNAPLSSVLDVVSKEFGVDASRIVKPSDLNGKQRKSAQEYIKNNSKALLDMLPEGETRSGQATGVANTKLGQIYEKGDRARFAEGASAAGKFTQTKRSDVTQQEFNSMFGIREDGTFDNNRKYDGAIKALVNQSAMIAANQALRENAIEKGTDPMSTIALLGDGKSEIMFSARIRKISNKDPKLGEEIMTQLRETDPSLYDASGKNVKSLIENRLSEQIERGDIKKGDVKAIVKDIEDVANLLGNMPEGDVIEGGKPVFESIIDRVQYNVDNPRPFYKTVAKNRTGEDIVPIDLDNAEHISLMETQVLKPLADFLGLERAKKLLFPSISAAAKLGTGVNTEVDGEIVPNPNYDASKKNTDRKGLAANASHANKILGTENVEINKEDKTPSIAYSAGKEGGWTSSRVNDAVAQRDKINKAQREANQGFRDIVEWIKTEYEAGRISVGQIVALLENFNSNPAALTRMAAIFDFVPTKDFDGKYTLEHMTPALMVNLAALDYILSGKDADAKKDFTDIMDNYRVAYLPKKYDNAINKHYKSRMPSWWTPDMPPLIRYFNPETYSVMSGLSLKQLSTGDVVTNEFVVDQKIIDRTMAAKRAALSDFVAEDASNHDVVQAEQTIRKVSMMRSARPKDKSKGITVLDFDDTLATTKSSVLYTAPDGTTGKLNAEEFAKQGTDLLAKGYKFDFSEFNKVVEGQTAPLFNKALKLAKKFGTDNMFILTARAPESQAAIKQFLDANGLNIPAENITGLGKSEASAKALWIAGKISEGYNDFYFADDAIQNVKAVKEMLEKHDVKSKVQQAKLEFSKRAPKQMEAIIDEGAADLDSDFNIILEQTKGVKRFKQFSAGKARQRGKNKGRFKFFIPPSADDFAGLLYSFMGKGKQGDKHHKFFKVNLFDPFSRGIRLLNRANQVAANDLKNLRKAFPDVRNKLKNRLPGLEYTTEDAIRVYNWNRQGFDIPGLAQTDLNAIVKAVEGDARLKAFADGVDVINISEAIVPDDSWLAGTIASDINEALEGARSTYLQEWTDNKNAIFTEANINKIEAVYGSNFREALEDSLFRMENGGNRSRGQGRLMNNFTNWIHGSIGTTMFFNARSAMLQMISNVNFINWSDNNMLAAAKVFANQPQYWEDVAMIFNSDFLKQRRGRIQTDVNAAELLAEIRDSKNPMKKATAYLLQLGFTPTQIADSFAIATGGATFYRNRINSHVKGGMSQADAETRAFEDMMEIAEETQQSTREDRISQQQASPLGKFILAFQNTPMQYNRLIKKAAQDLVNGRGNATSNVSKIVYYGAIQNMIFYGLQQALFAALFGDDEEDQIDEDKKGRVINGMFDTVLRGSGIAGAVASTTKNVILRFMKEEEKADDGKFYTEPDHAYTVIEALNLSPPIGIKARKLYSAAQTWEFNREVIDYMDKTDPDNPVYDAVFSATEAVTNLPLSRLYSKYQNIKEAANSDHETWKRVAMLLGWSKWNFGIKNQDVMSAKNEIKEIKAVEAEERREQKKIEREVQKADEELQVIEDNKLDQDEEREEGAKEVQCAAVSRSGKRCSNIALPGKSFCTVHDEVPQQTKEVQCSHIKKDGKRCKMKTKNKSGKCYYHD